MALGYKENHALGGALKINNKRLDFSRAQVLQKFKAVLDSPESFVENAGFEPLANVLLNIDKIDDELTILNDKPPAYTVYGAENMEESAREQMNITKTLPVTIAGALMPDAHQGYGLAIAGVLATKKTLIP